MGQDQSIYDTTPNQTCKACGCPCTNSTGERMKQQHTARAWVHGLPHLVLRAAQGPVHAGPHRPRVRNFQLQVPDMRWHCPPGRQLSIMMMSDDDDDDDDDRRTVCRHSTTPVPNRCSRGRIQKGALPPVAACEGNPLYYGACCRWKRPRKGGKVYIEKSLVLLVQVATYRSHSTINVKFNGVVNS
jgi:hypothetical protein